MKNTIYLVIAHLAFCLCGTGGAILAQEKPEYSLKGVMEMKTGETFPYRIVFTEEDGTISGFSYTFAPPQETKTVIRGSIDRTERKINFKETEIVVSKGMPTKAFLCLVNASLLYEKSYRGATLSGPMTNRQADRTSCTPGTLIFNSADELLALFQPKEKFDTVISMKRKAPETATRGIKVSQPEETPVKTEPERVTAGEAKSYDWYTDTLVLDVWDGGTTDGDKITVAFNGINLLERYPLVKEKKRLKIPVPANKTNILTIMADNEGSDPPNTATLLMTDGDKKHRIVAYNPMGQQAIIRIKRVN